MSKRMPREWRECCYVCCAENAEPRDPWGYSHACCGTYMQHLATTVVASYLECPVHPP